ncbi:MAG: histone family protein [Methanosphaera sp.]|nr:histone family protein [Methanosphaera sp.]
MTELPLAPVKRIIQKAGGKRISDEAVVELANVMEEYGEEVAEVATKFANHAGRKTVTAADIKLAIR